MQEPHGERLIWMLLACSEPVVEVAAPVPVPVEPAPAPVDPAALTLDIVDRATLAKLEQAGLDLGSQLGGSRGHNAKLATQPGYRALLEPLTAQIAAATTPIERPLVVELHEALAYPAGNVGRRFDPRWLTSEHARFDLVGVVNRTDRADFTGSCGEIRLIYRLGYQIDGQGSPLPFTLNVVREVPATADCRAFARSWLLGDDPVQGLLQGPLAASALRQIEVNAQIVRFPSGLETEFAGQAAYLLLVLDPTGALRPLENTPDVARLRADPALHAELTTWIGDHATEIDLGVHVLPPQFLAKQALSWSTLGTNRVANKPFAALYPPAEHGSLPPPPPDARFVAGAPAWLERLDAATCMGCHQSRSTAGFHFLGEDDPALSGITNRLLQPRSQHALAELPRRRAQVAALANGTPPDRYRPHPLVPPAGVITRLNAPCAPDPSLLAPGALPTCADGFACEVVVEEPGLALPLGQCVVPVDRASELTAGQTCRQGVIRPDRREASPFNAHAYADRIDVTQRYGLPEDKAFSATALNCRPTRIGVPLGRTYRSCTPAERSLEGPASDDAICAIVGGSRFDACVEQNFHACLAGIVARGMVDRCHPTRACREDYICQQLPYQLDGIPTERGEALTKQGVGFCTPTYFVFQLRLDGHPTP